jgi:hypothetical protein
MKKAQQFHEILHKDESIDLPSERSFAHVMAAAFYIIAAIVWWNSEVFDGIEIRLTIIGSLFLAVGYMKPLWLRPLNKLWLQFGLLLFKITNPIIMLLIYVITILPIGLIMRVMGKDPLRRKKDVSAESYWIVREHPGPAPDTIKRQF